MKSEEIKIEVNIAGEIIAFPVSISGQDAVREIEADLAVLYKELKIKHPRFDDKKLLAMMAYEFAKRYHSLKSIHTSAISMAEDLLEEASRLCGDAEIKDEDGYDDFRILI